MSKETFTLYSSKDAKIRFGEVLDQALGEPVGITRHDRLTAYIVSKRTFESLLSRVQELEDQLWLSSAENARAEGFAGPQRVDAFLRNFSDDADAVKNDEASTQVSRRTRR